jgi:peptidoglycan hydrolase-like protein with peptidoglycan-binding domain
MHVQGLDRAAAPEPATARKMLDKIGGRWWNVYIGGPESGGHGWTPELVREYVRHGIDRFMLTYVGRQSRGPLTAAQGRVDGLEALRIARAFGYTGAVPLCLDVEGPTYSHAGTAACEYARAWCATVRDGGARPGVYSNPAPLEGMAAHRVPAEFVWVAAWVSHGAAPHDPHAIPHFPGNLWSREGSRAWQYAGAYGNASCRVMGLDVDINVADLGCLAGPPGHAAAAAGRPRPHVLRRGARGRPVVRLTTRLSAVRSPASGAPYLAGPRRRFDAPVERAVRVFQRDHHLDADGIYGRETARALARAVERRRHAGAHSSNGANGAGGSSGGSGPGSGSRSVATAAGPASSPARVRRPPSLRTLIDDVRRLDAESERAWQRLVSYGEARVQRATGGDGAEARELAEIASILKRMELTLEALVTVEREELALEQHEAAEHDEPAPPVATAEPKSPLEKVLETAAAAATAIVTETSGAARDAAASEPRKPLVLAELSDAELEERADRLRHAANRSRAELVRRFVAAERKLGPMPAARVPGEVAASAGKPAPGHPGAKHRGPVRRPAEGHGPAGQSSAHRERRAEPHIRDLQTALNRFTAKYLGGLGPLIVDGKKGPATVKRIRQVKYYLGYKRGNRRSASADPDFLRRMAHPRSARASNPAMLARATGRRRKQRKAAAAAAAPRAGVGTFDNRPVAAWLVPYLEWARANGWQGSLNSGYRTPEYSEHLCMGICGAVRCPGRCAGRTSNHTQRVKPQGAIDVSDYVRFGELMKRCPHSPHIFNNLPSDRVHYSSTGG